MSSNGSAGPSLDPHLDDPASRTSSTVTLDLYERWSEDYEADTSRWGYNAPEVTCTAVGDLIRGTDPTTIQVLDAGAGNGLLVPHLVKMGVPGSNVVAVDLSKEMLARAAERDYYRETAVVDLSKKIPLPDNAFNIVFCVGTLTYLDPAAAALPEMARVTRPGGLVCFTMRTDLVCDWEPVLERMVEAGVLEQRYASANLPYLPNKSGFEELDMRVFAYEVKR